MYSYNTKNALFLTVGVDILYLMIAMQLSSKDLFNNVTVNFIAVS